MEEDQKIVMVQSLVRRHLAQKVLNGIDRRIVYLLFIVV